MTSIISDGGNGAYMTPNTTPTNLQRRVQRKANEQLYSFSGADAKTYTWFDANSSDVQLLDTVHTISVSVHDAKGQARRIGHRGISGITSSIRTVAGSVILTVINDHPLASVMDQYSRLQNPDRWGWSMDRETLGVGTLKDEFLGDNILPTMLPEFNVAVYYVNELSNNVEESGNSPDEIFLPQGTGLLVKGVSFLDDGIVTSVNDIVSEVTLSFIARDVKPMARLDFDGIRRQASRDTEIVKQQNKLMKRLRG